MIQKGARAALDTVEVARRGYQQAAHRRDRRCSTCCLAFVISSSIVRLTTFGVRRGVPLLFNVRIGRRHIHHFVPGILLAFASGSAALFASDPKVRETLAIPLGIGIGLTFDESALLLELEDVYWSREGLVGVQITLATASLMAAGMLALRILRRGEREHGGAPRAPAAACAPYADESVRRSALARSARRAERPLKRLRAAAARRRPRSPGRGRGRRRSA